MQNRREGIQILLALMLGDNLDGEDRTKDPNRMDWDISRKPFPADTLGVSLSLGTKKIIVRADGRVAEFSVKQLMDALGGR